MYNKTYSLSDYFGSLLIQDFQQIYYGVFVPAPPDILDYPTSSDLVVREGSNVTLQCAATGSPVPTVTWRKEDGSAIYLDQIPNRGIIII